MQPKVRQGCALRPRGRAAAVPRNRPGAEGAERSREQAGPEGPACCNGWCTSRARGGTGPARIRVAVEADARPGRSAVGAGSRQLDGRRLETLDRPEHELRLRGAVGVLRGLDVDDDRLADPELLPGDLLGERVFDGLLDRTAKRPGPELGLVALAGHEGLRLRRELEPDPLTFELLS